MSSVVFFSVWGKTVPIPPMGNGINKVLPGLYVGNFRDSKDRNQLQQNNITHILSIHDNAAPILKDMQYLCINASDMPAQNLSQYFPKVIEFIHKSRLSGGSVLVHCLAGVSRSVTVTVAYMMTVTDHSWRNCLNAVRQARPCANPNFGFQKQLQAFEDMNLEKERKWLRQKYGPIARTDHEYIDQLLKEYRKTHTSTQGPSSCGINNPTRPSGSYAAAVAPVNRTDDLYPFSSAPGPSGRNKQRDGIVFKK